MKFENFFKDMGARPIGKTLDRKNSDKNYSKSNCKWSTPKEQARNRSSNKTVFLNGKKRCISEISEITKIHKGTLWNRINRGFKNGDIYAAV